MPDTINQTLRDLPSVNKIIEEINPQEYNLPYSIILKTVRNCISDFRKKVIEGQKLNIQNLDLSISEELNNLNKPSVQSVINGTGIILHTGLGRAPISEKILNFNKTVNTQDDSDWEEIQN